MEQESNMIVQAPDNKLSDPLDTQYMRKCYYYPLANISIPTDLRNRLKIYASVKGVSIRSVVVEILERELNAKLNG